MTRTLLATSVLAVLSSVSDQAQGAVSDAELSDIRQQLQGLMQRVDKLEQENSSLKDENQQLKSQSDYLKSETRGLRKEAAVSASEVGKLKGADWAGRVAVKGDLRYRHEQISDETVNAAGVQTTADRYRDRVRARVNVEAKATDNILLGIGMATTEGGDPRSSNQSLDGTFSRKSLDLDLAYFDWTFASWGHLIGGKMKQPFVKPGQALFWDNDVNPEGLAFTLNRGIWFAGAYNFWVDEVSGAEDTLTADANLAGAQLGAKIPFGASTLTLGAHYYDLSAGQGRRGIFFNCSNPTVVPNSALTAPTINLGNNNCANGNTVIGANGQGVLANDFEVAEVFAEFNTAFGTLPFQVWADAAENQAADDLNQAWAAGVRLGAASAYRSWEVGAAYEKHEKDSLFAQLVDSDFGGGLTDTEGWVLRAGYVPVRNWTLNATYFINKLNVDVPNSVGAIEVDYDRLQLDFNLKF